MPGKNECDRRKAYDSFNSIWAILDLNLDLHGEKQETTCLSYSTEFYAIPSTRYILILPVTFMIYTVRISSTSSHFFIQRDNFTKYPYF